MATFNLNLTKNYCSSWGVWEAVREIIQNGLDNENQNSQNKFSMEYNPNTEKLYLSNTESILERNTILMGKTTKENDEKSIGQYGEGYKVALAVLTRLGKPVYINNYKKNEKWQPVLIKDKQYGGEEVVKLKITSYVFKKTPDNNLTWVIGDITQEEYDKINENYITKKSVKGNFYSSSLGDILFDEVYRGHIFVSGLFVGVNKNIKYGYSFPPNRIKLDRDRRTVADFELQWNTSSIWSEMSKEEKYSSVVKEAVKSGIPDLIYINSYTLANSQSVKALVEDFKSEYGDRAYPVMSQKERDSITVVYPEAKPIFVHKTYSEALKSSEEYKDIDSFYRSKNLKGCEVTPSQRLTMFLSKYENQLSFEIEEELKEIIERSKFWKEDSEGFNKSRGEEENMSEVENFDKDKIPF